MDDDCLEELAILLLLEWKKKKNCFRRSLSRQQRRNRTGYYRRRALQAPENAPFWNIYNSGQDDALITLTGFNHRYFAELHALFQPLFDSYTPYSADGIRIKKKRARGGKNGVLLLLLVWPLY